MRGPNEDYHQGSKKSHLVTDFQESPQTHQESKKKSRGFSEQEKEESSGEETKEVPPDTQDKVLKKSVS
jgi:hypothetical protein